MVLKATKNQFGPSHLFLHSSSKDFPLCLKSFPSWQAFFFYVRTHFLCGKDNSVRAPKEFSCSSSAMILSPMYPDTSRSNTILQTHNIILNAFIHIVSHTKWKCIVQKQSKAAHSPSKMGTYRTVLTIRYQ